MLSRRDYVRLLGAATATLGMSWAKGQVAAAEPSVKQPGLGSQTMTQTGSQMAAPLWMQRAGEEFFFDAYSAQGYATASYLMRDVRAHVIGRPSPWLLRSMSQMQVWWAAMGHHVRLDITSGLRTPQTNSGIEGAARSSRHLPGPGLGFDAVDFRPGRVDLSIAAQWARAAGVRGLGLYPDRHFLHMDLGRVRQWTSR